MKQPLFIGCLSYILTLAVAVTIPSNYLNAAAAILATVAFFIFLISIKRKTAVKYLYITAISLLSILGFIVYSHTTLAYANQLPGKTVNLTATVIENGKTSSGNTYVVAKLNTVNNNDAARGVKVKIYTTNHEVFDDYDEISTTVSFYDTDYTPASERYFISNSVFASGTTTKSVAVINKDEFSLFREICKFRDELIFRLRYSIPSEEGDIVCGILFGKRENVDPKTTDLFSAAGISHLLAVSGMHLTIIIGLMELFLKLLRINKKIRALISLILCFFMMIVTGFTPSIIRASIMALFLLVAQLIRHDYDSTTALGISAVVICMLNPYAIINVGFLLSFCATYGLIVSNRIIDMMRRRFSLKTVGFFRLFIYEILKLFLPCVFAFMFTIPITTCTFGTFSIYSPIVNLLISPLIPVLILFIIFSSITTFLPTSIISSIIFLVTKLLVSCVVWVAEIFSSLPFATVNIDFDLIIPTTIVIVLLFIIAVLSKHPIRNTVCAITLSICLLCFSLITHSYNYRDTITVNIVNSSVIVETNDKILVSGYSKNSSYKISNILSDSSNKKLCYISAENAQNKDISSLTHFLVSHPAQNTAVLDKHLTALNTISQINSKIHSVNGICAKFNDISVTTKIYGKNSITVFDINGFKIASLNIKSRENLPEKFSCDLLITNSSALVFIENYSAKYFLLSEKASNPKHLSAVLSKHKIKYLGDTNYGEIIIKENSLYTRRDFLNLAL